MTASREIRDPETKLESLPNLSQKFPKADVSWHLRSSRHRVSDQSDSWAFRRRRDAKCIGSAHSTQWQPAVGVAPGAAPGVPGCAGCAELVGAHTYQWAVEPVY